jgi:hypothetical protein
MQCTTMEKEKVRMIRTATEKERVRKPTATEKGWAVRVKQAKTEKARELSTITTEKARVRVILTTTEKA